MRRDDDALDDEGEVGEALLGAQLQQPRVVVQRLLLQRRVVGHGERVALHGGLPLEQSLHFALDEQRVVLAEKVGQLRPSDEVVPAGLVMALHPEVVGTQGTARRLRIIGGESDGKVDDDRVVALVVQEDTDEILPLLAAPLGINMETPGSSVRTCMSCNKAARRTISCCPSRILG